ncbi:MAG: NAD-dependent epimerase/dehydratase family protein [Candidatus Omnitrophica bacterium]|nr:NAD-dependent epimerase/dehydratase family protein [Candidatus Omnitrophota bacterium]
MPGNRLIRQLQDRSILITGGGGFLGGYLFRRLRQMCRRVSLYNGDVRDIGNFRERYDLVCHLAAVNKTVLSGGIGELFEINTNGTLSVMRYCLRNGARCLFASSSAVYKPARQKEWLSEHSPIIPQSLYGVSKMLAEDICEYHAKNFGLGVIAFRIFNMYGPGQKAPFLIPYVLRQLSRRQPVVLKSPMAVRDFVYISDVVNAFVLSCALKFKGFLALNIGSGKGLSVYGLAKRLALLKGVKYKIDRVNNSDHKRSYIIADLKNTRKTLGWSPEIALDNGLMEVVRLS